LPDAKEQLELVEADLLSSEAVWDSTVAGVRQILHVASPFPPNQPSDENELIKPAVEGTLAVLKSAARWNAKTTEDVEKIRRVVVTSSVAAISNGWGAEGENRTWRDDD
jgi:nucleoside-diphosphate-sugar epimerase